MFCLNVARHLYSAGQPVYDPRGHVQCPAVCPKSLHLQQRPVVPVSCRFMKTLKESVHTLVLTAEKGKQAEILRQINRMFLREYMIQLDAAFRLYPIEAEAYYYNESNFPDTTVHRNDLQKNRFGKLYFHRAGRSGDTAFLYDRGGVDVCLSCGNYYLGILIRSAWINSEARPVCGPGLLCRRMLEHILGEAPAARREKDRRLIEDREELEVVFPALNDKRDKDSPLLCGYRYGIKPANHPEYSQYKLRSLIEAEKPDHPFKDKRKIRLFSKKQ